MPLLTELDDILHPSATEMPLLTELRGLHDRSATNMPLLTELDGVDDRSAIAMPLRTELDDLPDRPATDMPALRAARCVRFRRKIYRQNVKSKGKSHVLAGAIGVRSGSFLRLLWLLPTGLFRMRRRPVVSLLVHSACSHEPETFP